MQPLQLFGLLVSFSFLVVTGISAALAIKLPENYKAWALAPLGLYMGVVGNPHFQLWLIKQASGLFNG